MKKLHYHVAKGNVACGARVRGKEGNLQWTAWTRDPLKVTCESCKRSRDVNAMILRDKVTTYETLLHDLYFAGEVAMNADRMSELLKRIGAWSFAHRSGNGELSDEEQAARVAAAYERLKQT